MRLRKKPWIEEAMKDVQDEYVFMHDIEQFKGHWQEMFPGKKLCFEIVCKFCLILFGFTVRVLYIIAYCANKVNYFLNCRPIFILFAQIFTYFFATIKLKSK